MARTNISSIIDALDFVRFTDAKVGRAFKHAIECWSRDMVVGEYEASDVAEPAFMALASSIKDYIDDIATTPDEPVIAAKVEDDDDFVLPDANVEDDSNEDSEE